MTVRLVGAQGATCRQLCWPGPGTIAISAHNPPLTFVPHRCGLSHNVPNVWLQRKGSPQKLDTPPSPLPRFLGGGGSGPPGHNFLQKVLIFFLNFIFQGHFGTCRAENCTFRAYTMKYWAKQATFWHKQGGYYLCSVGSCGAILL